MSSIVVAGDTSGSITLSAPATSGSSVLTLPVATDTLVGKATTDTLTNKTLTSPTITGATITVTGQATIPTINLTGGQITFPATQSASTNANTLDDYEEGTWTPTIYATGTPAYLFQEGWYTKIGNVVHGGGIIGVTNNSSLTGEFRIALPFTVISGAYGFSAGTVSDGSGFTWPMTAPGGTVSTINLQAQHGQNYMQWIPVATTAAGVYYNQSGIANTWYFRFNFTIKTT